MKKRNNKEKIIYVNLNIFFFQKKNTILINILVCRYILNIEVRKWKTTVQFLPLGFGTEETTQENRIFMNTLKITYQSLAMYRQTY